MEGEESLKFWSGCEIIYVPTSYSKLLELKVRSPLWPSFHPRIGNLSSQHSQDADGLFPGEILTDLWTIRSAGSLSHHSLVGFSCLNILVKKLWGT